MPRQIQNRQSKIMLRPSLALTAWGVLVVGYATAHAGDNDLPHAKPVPAVQVIPLPYDQASFQHRGRELTRYHFGGTLKRTFWYPLQGPAARSLTRMGNPQAPFGERHHYSVWFSHKSVNGVSFWENDSPGRVVHRKVEQYSDGAERASMLSLNAWQTSTDKVLMIERRRCTVRPFGPDDWMMIIDVQLEAVDNKPVTLGKTAYGMLGVRMAKTIDVLHGGGRILNSAGQLNENQAFRKPARWVDFSGPVTNRASGGITLMDHPANPNHPAPFHVRDVGFMMPCLTLNRPLVIEPDHPLRLCYGLWMHAGVAKPEQIEDRWKAFVAEQPGEMTRTTR